MSDKNVVARTVKFDEKSYEAIKKLAADDRRSFQAEVAVLLDEALDARQPQIHVV